MLLAGNGWPKGARDDGWEEKRGRMQSKGQSFWEGERVSQPGQSCDQLHSWRSIDCPLRRREQTATVGNPRRGCWVRFRARSETRWVSMGLVLHQFRFDAGILPTTAMAKQGDDTSNCCEKGRTTGNGVVRRTYFRLRDRRRWSREGEGDAMARGKPTLWHAFGKRLARMKKTRRQTGWPRWDGTRDRGRWSAGTK